MSESEQQAIEKDANLYATNPYNVNPVVAYIAGSTAMAEKKNVEAESREHLLEEYSSALLSLRKKNDINLAQLEAAQEELEKERLRLAACGVAALSNTEESIKNQRLASDSEYYSGSYEDVCRAVNREMSYREELSRVKEVASRMAQHLMHYVNEEDEIGTQILNNYKNGLLH